MSELSAEDAKLITLARSARARNRADQGAAVRDSDGRTYVASTVWLPSLSVSALQLAVAMAASSGVTKLEAAVILGEWTTDEEGMSAAHELSPGIVIHTADVSGRLTAQPVARR